VSTPALSHRPSGETGSETVERVARRNPWVIALGRTGWVAKGVVYLMLGILAVPIAFEASGVDNGAATTGGEASQTGAVAEIADTSFGKFALYVIAIGLFIYVLWRLVSIVLPAENTAVTWLTRIGYLVSAVMYTLLGLTALSFASRPPVAAGAESEDAKVERFTRSLMEHSGGRWLVGMVGAVAVIVGVVFIVKGLKATFRDDLEPRGVGPISHDAIVTLGRIGWAGRGAVMGLIGWLLVRAALHNRPDEAKGFDGALREVTDSGVGTVLVGFTAVALALYGLFCVVSAPRQKLTGAD
jgi:hypothetical protein